MQLQLHINYHTAQQETLFVEITIDGAINSYPMHPTLEGYWTFVYLIPNTCKAITYHYSVRSSENEVVCTEWNKDRTIDCSDQTDQIIMDAWTNIPPDFPYYSSAFTQGFYQRERSKGKKTKNNNTLRLEISAPTLPPYADLILTGASNWLGNWDTSWALTLDDSQAPLYKITLSQDWLYKGQPYKFAARNRATGEIIAWDKGENRTIPFDCPSNGTSIMVRDLIFKPQLPPFRCAGVAIPVFSLRSKSSWGIGEYNDLKLMVDWAKLTGQRIIQILPINDTTLSHRWTDSYPYNSNSIFALHPIYLNPSAMGALSDKRLYAKYETKRKALNALDKVDYEAVEQLKWNYFRALFDREKTTYQQDKTFKQWYKSNRDWLVPYSAFCYLRDAHLVSNIADWGEYALYDAKKTVRLVEAKGQIKDDCGLYIFLQYHAHLQLSEVTSYAHSQGVVLKGDIPIGISRDSVEAWVEPHLFNMTGQAGAPPDDFSKNGQNWGFPTYRWEEMSKDGFAWWKHRFCKMAQYFDAYRIDHLLGFFRIWEIPMDSIEGLLGHFNPALPLSPEEMASYGFQFNCSRMLHPYLTAVQVETLFGTNASFAFEHLFDHSESGFTLKPEYRTQRAVAAACFSLEEAVATAIKQALFQTINDVLFVEDSQHRGKYHPRITGYDTFAFHSLEEPMRQAFIRLYEDFFFVRHNGFWKQMATERLSELVSATKMLVCAEDLGMIPACVPEVMEKLQMLSLEIQRMPKAFGVRFADTTQYPVLAVASSSTHDMSNIREWWEEDSSATQDYYTYVLRQEGMAPTVCNGEIVQHVIRLHLESSAMLTILPLQDWLASDEQIRREDCREERINVPSNPKHYWQYRMHISLEKLLKASELNRRIAEMIQTSGR